jgi:hypothetical protein
VADPLTPTLTATFGFTLQIGSDPDKVEIPVSTTLPAPADGSREYKYTNPGMKWTSLAKHIPNPEDPASKPSKLVLPVGAFLTWVGSALSGGTLSVTDLPSQLRDLKVGVDYLFLSQTTTPKHTVFQLSLTLLAGDNFATFTPIDGLSLTASSPYLSVVYDKTG